ncbi:MAG: ABC transporter permease subunit [Aeromonadales bacterium]|nr:ABC transporter permease subunit [Aeromonadales bacterium]MDY2891411.1 ABC transporter permease subunit [Succinivibrio sp.]
MMKGFLKHHGASNIAKAVILLLALIFLYTPIMTLVVYSFNESKMVTIWTTFSLHWYNVLVHDSAIISALCMSLTIAVMAASASVIIGTMAAFVMVRVRQFAGESAFMLFMTAPMVLPEVITGLALLLLYVTLGDFIPVFADRGIIAIWVAHVTFCSAYATVVIRSRFIELDTSVEEAAKDLGAGPLKVFFAIMLPSLMPAEVAAFLLSFTMSMDDLVITSFIAGPESTTLPMLIFSSIRRGLSPEINALAAIIIFVASIGTFIGWLSMVRKQKRIAADVAKAQAEAKRERESSMLGGLRG